MNSRSGGKMKPRLPQYVLALILIVCHQRHCALAEIQTASSPEPGLPTYNSYSPPVESSDNGLPPSSSWRNFGSLPPSDIMKKVMSKGCSHRYTLTCLKLDVVSLVDRLSEQDKYQLMPGVTVVKDNNSVENEGHESSSRKFPADLVASLAKDYPNDVEARLDGFLLRRVGQYLNSHSITFKLFDEESFAKARQLEQEAAEQMQNDEVNQTGRKGYGGKGGKKGMGQLMMALLMMKGTLIPIAFGALAMLAGKALMTGLLSLMLSAIIGLKSLTSGSGKQAVTYEIVQKPVYSHSHSHSHELHHDHLGGHSGGGGGGGGSSYGHSSFGRSFDSDAGVSFQDEEEDDDVRQSSLKGKDEENKQLDAHQMAYSSYIQSKLQPTPTQVS